MSRHTPTPKKKKCQAIEWNDVLTLHTERATGIEPASSAWEAEALPLSYARWSAVMSASDPTVTT